MFEALLLGAGIGLIAVMTPGPVTLALLEIGSSRGSAPGLRAGLGIAGADIAMSAIALALVLGGADLAPSIMSLARTASSVFLVGVGVGLLVRPSLGPSLVGRLRHPFRSMFAVTALNPSVLGAWIALFMSMPFSDDPRLLGTFAAGGLVVSCLWHLGLGSASGAFAMILSDGRRVTLARVGGISMLGLAMWTMS